MHAYPLNQTNLARTLVEAERLQAGLPIQFKFNQYVPTYVQTHSFCTKHEPKSTRSTTCKLKILIEWPTLIASNSQRQDKATLKTCHTESALEAGLWVFESGCELSQDITAATL